MSSSDNPTVKRLEGVADPLSRAVECQEVIARGRSTITAVQHLRDEAIRAAHRGGMGTIDEIAGKVKVKRNVVVYALREKQGGER